MIFKRKKYLDELIAGRGNGLVKIITGVRRCGKSFLLFVFVVSLANPLMIFTISVPKEGGNIISADYQTDRRYMLKKVIHS